MKRQAFSNGPALLLVFVTVLCGSVFAQPPRGGPPDPRERERIQSVIIGKFATEMDLTPEQAEKFYPRLKQFQNRMEEVERDAHQARMELDQLSQTPNGDPQELNSLLQRRKSTEQGKATIKEEFLTDISSFLTPQQVSRCSILLDDIPQKMREFIRAKERERGYRSQPSQPQSREGGARPRRRGY